VNTHTLTRSLSQSFLDEMRGISDASGVDYKSVLRLNMFPELTKVAGTARCQRWRKLISRIFSIAI
jgi:hypothetical protein